MPQSTLNVLFIADIVGDSGIAITCERLPSLKRENDIQLCIANGENASGGKGLNVGTVEKLFDAGVQVITSGNHIWEKEYFLKKLDKYSVVLRPANYPSENVGKGSLLYTLADGGEVGILNLQGRVFMSSIDCPFKTALYEIRKLKKHTPCVIVDFHAEATAEKIAMGRYLDGQVSAVIGTHTHVQTADEQILPEKTAYITDAGMTGPIDSVIGVKYSVAIRRFIYQTPVKYAVADGIAQLNGVLLSIDRESGCAQSITRIRLTQND
jgi:hypothetical protein